MALAAAMAAAAKGKGKKKPPKKTKPAKPKAPPKMMVGPNGPLQRPPASSYDPALDASERAASRGLLDLQQDTERSAERNQTDYQRTLGDYGRTRNQGFADYVQQTRYNAQDNKSALDRMGQDYWTTRNQATEDYNTTRSRGLADFGQQSERGLADFAQTRTRGEADFAQQGARGTEDYNTSVAGLNRQYQRLGNSQKQAGNAAGVTKGGFLAQAMAKRAENQAIDKAPIDTNYQRFGQDLSRDQGRFNTDLNRDENRFTTDLARDQGRFTTDLDTNHNRFLTGQNTSTARTFADILSGGQRAKTGLDTTLTRQGQALDRGVGQAGLTQQRGVQDQQTNLARAGRENTFFQQDTAAARFGQAKAGGWVPQKLPSSKPKKPKKGKG